MAYGPASTREKSATSTPVERACHARPPRPRGQVSGQIATVSCGTAASRAKSALISPGRAQQQRQVLLEEPSTDVSAAWALTLTDGDHPPAPSRSGAATERMPRASCSSVSAQPRARTSRSAASRSARRAASAATRPDRVGWASTAVQLGGGQLGQQHLAQRRRQRREPGADLHRKADDLGDGHPGDVDDVRAVELGHRARLVGAGDQRLHVRAGDVPQALRPHVGHAEVEHPRRERVPAAVDADVAELGEREQDPACGRPRRGPQPRPSRRAAAGRPPRPRRAGILLHARRARLRPRADGRYELTPRVLDLGAAYVGSQGLWDVARPHLQALSASTNESCSIAQLDGPTSSTSRGPQSPRSWGFRCRSAPGSRRSDLARQGAARRASPAAELDAVLAEPTRSGLIPLWHPEPESATPSCGRRGPGAGRSPTSSSPWASARWPRRSATATAGDRRGQRQHACRATRPSKADATTCRSCCDAGRDRRRLRPAADPYRRTCDDLQRTSVRRAEGSA